MVTALPLHAIDQELAELEALIIEADGVVDETTEARLDELLDAREDKLETMHALIARAELEAAGWKKRAEPFAAEAARLAGHAKPHETLARRLRERVMTSMIERGELAYETPLGKLRVQYSGSRAVVLLVDAEQLPDEWKRVTVEPDKVALKAAIAAGEADGIAVLADPSPFLRIT